MAEVLNVLDATPDEIPEGIEGVATNEHRVELDGTGFGESDGTRIVGAVFVLDDAADTVEED